MGILFDFLLITVPIIWFIYAKTYWFRDIEKISEKYRDDLQKIALRDDESAKSQGSIGMKEHAKRSRKEYEMYCKTHENYLHLVERYKHNKRSKEARKDWENYLRAIKRTIDADMEYSFLDGKQLEEVQREHHLAYIKIVEIEKRLSKP